MQPGTHSDVYSMGCTMLTTLLARDVWGNLSDQKVMTALLVRKRLPESDLEEVRAHQGRRARAFFVRPRLQSARQVKRLHGERIEQLIRSCVCIDPSERVSMTTVVEQLEALLGFGGTLSGLISSDSLASNTSEMC